MILMDRESEPVNPESNPETTGDSNQSESEVNAAQKAITRKSEDEQPNGPPEAKKLKTEETMDNDHELHGEIMEIDNRGELFPNLNNYEKNYTFNVLTIRDLLKCTRQTINEICDILNLSQTEVRCLLNHFKWNRDKLMEDYLDGDQLKLLRAAGVDIETGVAPAKKLNTGECGICCVEKAANELYHYRCDHYFCKECWKGYVSSKIMDGVGEKIICAAHNCPRMLDDEIVLQFISDEMVMKKYLNLLANSFVHNNRLLSWCQSPGCSKVVQVDRVESKPVTCSCCYSFCFSCNLAWHGPITCNMLKMWIKKCDDDSETSNWISAHTKDCPKCKSPIEKNGGCNHMTCTKPSCKHHFCWVCMEDWQKHTGDAYKCNKYDSTVKETQTLSRISLQRYLFYCNRYMNHLRSLKFEKELSTTIKQKMEELQKENNMTYFDVLFLSRAVRILCECRQTLMYTYAFAFYLEKNNPAMIFEDNQSDLERATESLSECLERELNTENIEVLKIKVQNLSVYCENRRLVLLEHVYEGKETEVWSYNDNFKP